MNSEKDYAPLSIACVRALNDKLYEKRKAAALEVEKMVRDFAARNDTTQVKKILRVLGQDFTLSQNPNGRKGGLIGLAAVAIALGKDTAQHIPELIQPILACFSDADVKVRYCACESLYNVVKVARGAVLNYFTEIFSCLSNAATDPDQGVKSGSETLDRLLKDIVTESTTFDLVNFMPLLRERISTKNDFARQFIISWISVLHTVPQIDMVLVLPEILDGLFKILEDTKTEIKTMCSILLSEFLISIKQNPDRVDFQGMINILVHHAQSQDDLVQLTAITWIKEFIQLSESAMLPYFSGILIAILPCLSYEADSKKNVKLMAKNVNYSLNALLTKVTQKNYTDTGSPDPVDALDLNSVTEVLIKFLLHTKVPTKVFVLEWISHLLNQTPIKIYDHMEKVFPVLMDVLSDPSDEVVEQDLGVLTCIVMFERRLQNDKEKRVASKKEFLPISKYFKELINQLIEQFKTNPKFLEDRGSFIIREICFSLNEEVVYKALSDALSEQSDMKFLSTMVDLLNTILLTSSELFDLRNSLKDLSQDQSRNLFSILYKCWCHNPAATVALCLLTQNYKLAYDIIRTFGYLEVTVEFLSDIDKLVQLIESPIFAYLRLELMEVPPNQHLVQALYGLLMILPQTETFHTLKRRLDCIPSLHFYKSGNQVKLGKDINQIENRFDFDKLLETFNMVQKHRKLNCFRNSLANKYS